MVTSNKWLFNRLIQIVLISFLGCSVFTYAATTDAVDSRIAEAARMSILSEKYFEVYFKVSAIAEQEEWADEDRGPEVLESLLLQDDTDVQAYGQFFLMINQAMSTQDRSVYESAVETYAEVLGLDQLEPNVLEQVTQVMITQLNNYSYYYDYRLD